MSRKPYRGRAPVGRGVLGFFVSIAAWACAAPLLAASGSWNVDADGLWVDSINWLDGITAAAGGSTATFANDITATRTVSLTQNRDIGAVVFGDADPLSSGGWILDGANQLNMNNLGGIATITVGDLGADATAAIGLVLGGSPLQSSAIVKDGPGTLVLGGVNVFGANLEVTAGTLQVSADRNLGNTVAAADRLTIANGATLKTTAGFTMNANRGVTIGAGGGVLDLNGGNLVYAGRFSGAGETITTTGTSGFSLTNKTGTASDVNWDFAGGGTRVFFTNLDGLGTGSVEVRSGVRLVSQNNATGIGSVGNAITIADGGGISARASGGEASYANVTFPSSGTVVFNKDDQATTALSILSGGELTGDLIVDTSQQTTNVVGDVTLGGSFFGAGGLGKTGTGDSGRLILEGFNTYTGATTIEAGTLVLAASGSIATSSAVAVAAAATFDATALGTYVVPANQTLAGGGTVAGDVAVGFGATLAPGASPGTLTFAGDLTLDEGGNYNWQMLSGTGTAGGEDAWDLASVGGSLVINATSFDPFTLNLWTLSGTGPDVSGPAANFDPSQSYAWTFASAAGGVTGFAADKFLIETAAANGTDGFANPFGTGTFAVDLVGNDLQLVFTPGASNDIVIDVPSGSQTQSEAGYPTIAVADSVTKTGAGTLVFDAANSFTGPTTVSAGTLEVVDPDALGSSTVTVATGATLSVDPATTMRSPSVIVDGGTLSASTLAIDGSSGIASLAINAGTLSGSAAVSVDAGGELALPQDARVSIGVGTLAVAEGSGGGLLDLGAGQVSVAAGGITAETLVNDIVAGRNGGGWDGAAGITSSAAAASGGTRAVGYVVNGDGSAIISFAAPGDTDLSGQVNVFDLIAIDSAGKFGSGQPASWGQGDFNYDGVSNVFDLIGIDSSGAYGAGGYFPASPSTAGIADVAAVPEPAECSLVLAGAGLVWVLKRLRRR